MRRTDAPSRAHALRALPGLVAWLVLMSGWSRAEDVPFYFYNFESGTPGMRAGEPPGRDSGFQVLQGSALVARSEGDAAGQYLNLAAGRPFSAVYLTGRRLAQDGSKTYLEIWVRPSATEAAQGEEFLDFDGAAVGFFKSADGRSAEIQAYHAISEDSGYWLSTGWQTSVGESGRPAEWLRVGIVQDWTKGTWQVEINGTPLLVGLRRHAGVAKDNFELRLYGQELGDCHFDDVLVSPLPPAEMEARSRAQDASRKSAARQAAPEGAKRVSSSQANQERRLGRTAKPDPAAPAAPVVLDMHLKVIGGGKHITEVTYDDPQGKKQTTILYSPGYDSEGKPLSLEVEIRCDAELKPGMALDKVLWAVTEQQDAKNPKPLTVLVHGTFATGPTQIAKVPAEWSNKPLMVHVGQLKLSNKAAATPSN